MFNINEIYNTQLGNAGDTDGASIETVRVIDIKESIMGSDIYIIATVGGIGVATPAPRRWGHPEGTMLYCTTLYTWSMVNAIVANFGEKAMSYQGDAALKVLANSKSNKVEFNRLARVA